MIPQKILKSCYLKTKFLAIPEDNFCQKCSEIYRHFALVFYKKRCSVMNNKVS